MFSLHGGFFSCALGLYRMYLLQRTCGLVKISQFYHFVYCGRRVLPHGCEVKLSAAAALYQLGTASRTICPALSPCSFTRSSLIP